VTSSSGPSSERGHSDPEDPDDEEPGLPEQGRVRPVPCMDCRTTVWVRGHRTYVRCPACEDAPTD
jgi:hypothetical protein